jgi:hypothetical protein
MARQETVPHERRKSVGEYPPAHGCCSLIQMVMARDERAFVSSNKWLVADIRHSRDLRDVAASSAVKGGCHVDSVTCCHLGIHHSFSLQVGRVERLKVTVDVANSTMCRFLVRLTNSILSRIALTYPRQIYKGRHEIRLSKLVTEPSHSILTQSYDSRLRLVSCWIIRIGTKLTCKLSG